MAIPRPMLKGGTLAALATLFVAANCYKPLHIDDTAYYYQARQIAERPADPYGYQLFWHDAPQPATELMPRPVLAYLLAPALRLFGERPVLWKLWRSPLSLIFVFSLHALLARFARGIEWPVLVMTVFSAPFLPSLNLMLDVPALGLMLGSVALFLSALDRDRPALAAAAGLVAALAIETKYTALVALALMLASLLVAPERLVWRRRLRSSPSRPRPPPFPCSPGKVS